MRGVHATALAVVVALAAFVYLGRRELVRQRAVENKNVYSALARILNQHVRREACDEQLAQRRYYASRVLDRFRADILGLWTARTGEKEPQFTLLDLGTIKLRISPKTSPSNAFDSSAWSWDEVYGLIQRTQNDRTDNGDRWRDVDSMVRFLLEKDYGRIVLGKKFLPPAQTQHQFRPNPDVTRTGPKEFTVRLDPGTLRGHERVLQKVLEDEWQGEGFRVKIQWAEGAYRLLTHNDSSRSFVNHRKRTMQLANLAWTRTVAHELGHVLGFDDHYYNVWNARNCYYSQESRLGDLMSNSEKGKVTARHWQLLEQAYPARSAAPKEPFVYLYGN